MNRDQERSNHAKKLTMRAPWLLACIVYLFLAEPGLAKKNRDRQNDRSSNGLVCGIELRKYRNESESLGAQNDIDDSPKELGFYMDELVRYAQEERLLIIVVGTVLLLMLVNYFAVTRAYYGRATYFANYGDVFWFCLPVAIILLTKVFVWWMFGDIYLGSLVVKVCLVFACVYNLIRPLIDNRRGPLLLAVSVCISRFTLGYMLILAIVYTLIGMYPAKQTDESNEAYEIRKQKDIIKGTAVLNGIGVLVRSLVGRAEYYDHWEYDDVGDL